MRTIALLLFGSLSLSATVIGSADGITTAGGTVSAVWLDGVTPVGSPFTIQASIPANKQGFVTQPTAFDFSIAFDTQGNPWSLKNNRASALTSFVINLTNATNGGLTAIFDMAGTANRVVGAGTVIPFGVTSGHTATAVFSSAYLGDGGDNLFRMLTVTIAGGGVAPGGTLIFNVDSDVISAVPEPSTWIATLAFCAIGLAGRRRRA